MNLYISASNRKHNSYNLLNKLRNENDIFLSLADLDISEGADFYAARQEKIEKLLNTASRELSEKQKNYWQDMNSKVDEPFQYGYYEGWEIIISSF